MATHSESSPIVKNSSTQISSKEARLWKLDSVASVMIQRQHPKKQRVAFTEPSNSPNIILPETLSPCKEKVQSWKDSDIKKSNSTSIDFYSSQIDKPTISGNNEYLYDMEVVMLT
ncbi:unnamed protein product [Sphenostylis stenocarpa]|uniref:Uncharacterized protein n=1 Tax=Sphenostylis stenocarpa TaxID=92480 RepID=A0AA86SVA5_9FABA|nr:unnamed protein product [Sphenostylis stenocarpa]